LILVVIYGPPGVGKLTTAKELAVGRRRTTSWTEG